MVQWAWNKASNLDISKVPSNNLIIPFVQFGSDYFRWWATNLRGLRGIPTGPRWDAKYLNSWAHSYTWRLETRLSPWTSRWPVLEIVLFGWELKMHGFCLADKTWFATFRASRQNCISFHLFPRFVGCEVASLRPWNFQKQHNFQLCRWRVHSIASRLGSPMASGSGIDNCPYI